MLSELLNMPIVPGQAQAMTEPMKPFITAVNP